MNRRINLVLILLLLMITVNGCWDRRELESLGIVQAIGLDLETKTQNLIVTTLIAIPSKLGGTSPGGGGGGGNESGVMVVSVKAPSIYEAFNLMNTSINREISLQQNQLLVFGSSVAKSGIHRWVDTLVRFREMRRTLLILVSQGKASEILTVQSPLEKNTAEYLSDLVNLSDKNGMCPRVMLNEFMERYEAFAQQNYAPLVAKAPLMETPDKLDATKKESSGAKNSSAKDKAAAEGSPSPTEVRLFGTAVFRGDKVVGDLDLYETQILRMITGQFGEAMLTVEDPIKKGYDITFRFLTAQAPQITYKKLAGVDQFHVKLHMEAELISIQSGINYTDPVKQNLLASRIAHVLEHRTAKVITKTQKQFHSDIFGFGIKVRNTMFTSTDWDQYHWPEKFTQAQIHVVFKVKIRRTGVQFQPPKNRG